MNKQHPPRPQTGDDIEVGNIENSNAVAIGDHATAIYVSSPEEAARFIAEQERIAQKNGQNATSPLPFPQPPNPTIKNPFGIAGKIQDQRYYLRRQPLTYEIFETLGNGASISLTGASQTGKSSLLWHITQTGAAVLNRPAEEFIYIDMQILHNDDDFFGYLCDELDIPVCRGYQLGRKLRGRKIVLCLDEFEKMKWEGFTPTVREELRGLADGNGKNQPFTLLIASRTPLDTLFNDNPDRTSPLANLCLSMKMPPFNLNEAEALTKLYLNGNNIELSDEAVKQAWQRSGGHPQTLQVELKTAFAMRHAA